ncbi:hypothetical protein AVEN_250945-1 [Araneus ventricosus]|uniref:Uncharacterized protein n=1 Tax=Araneus ventricosus TaxID=182803 RepID=A0A4Y2PSP0_ARAVE|nr:hypothetical protein AVEN_157285-1 [Araneus ventricosus]GBN54908.1 hypothetical protein AVEN_250945-1 [Araneus ventricosus]
MSVLHRLAKCIIVIVLHLEDKQHGATEEWIVPIPEEKKKTKAASPRVFSQRKTTRNRDNQNISGIASGPRSALPFFRVLIVFSSLRLLTFFSRSASGHLARSRKQSKFSFLADVCVNNASHLTVQSQ